MFPTFNQYLLGSSFITFYWTTAFTISRPGNEDFPLNSGIKGLVYAGSKERSGKRFGGNIIES